MCFPTEDTFNDQHGLSIILFGFGSLKNTLENQIYSSRIFIQAICFGVLVHDRKYEEFICK